MQMGEFSAFGRILTRLLTNVTSIDPAQAIFLRRAVSIGHGDTMLRDQLIEDLDRLLPA
jgi:hypothetical protein